MIPCIIIENILYVLNNGLANEKQRVCLMLVQNHELLKVFHQANWTQRSSANKNQCSSAFRKYITQVPMEAQWNVLLHRASQRQRLRLTNCWLSMLSSWRVWKLNILHDSRKKPQSMCRDGRDFLLSLNTCDYNNVSGQSYPWNQQTSVHL